VRHGVAQALADYEHLTTSDELAPLRQGADASARFAALLDKYKLVPSRLARELDFSSSSLGRYVEANRFKAKQ
jgi:hypothetical protein